MSNQPDELQKAIERLTHELSLYGIHDQFEKDIKDTCDAAKQLRQVEKEKQVMGIQLDHLLDHCKDSECEECSKIICPHQEPLHFHHDGCPSCVAFEQMRDKRDQLKAALEKCARALLTAQGTVECASIDLNTQEELPWYKQAKEALSSHIVQSVLKGER